MSKCSKSVTRFAKLSGGSGVIPEPTVKVWMGEDDEPEFVAY